MRRTLAAANRLVATCALHVYRQRVAMMVTASTRGVGYELSLVASRAFWFAQAGQADESTVATTITEEKHEKNTLNHWLGSSGVLGVGTDN